MKNTLLYSMQHIGHTYTKKYIYIFIVYSKFTFYWTSCNCFVPNLTTLDASNLREERGPLPRPPDMEMQVNI